MKLPFLNPRPGPKDNRQQSQASSPTLGKWEELHERERLEARSPRDGQLFVEVEGKQQHSGPDVKRRGIFFKATNADDKGKENHHQQEKGPKTEEEVSRQMAQLCAMANYFQEEQSKELFTYNQ